MFQRMAAQSMFPVYDRLLDGTLADVLRRYRAEGESFQKIAKRLYADYDVDVDTSTVRLWCHQNLEPAQ